VYIKPIAIPETFNKPLHDIFLFTFQCGQCLKSSNLLQSFLIGFREDYETH